MIARRWVPAALAMLIMTSCVRFGIPRQENFGPVGTPIGPRSSSVVIGAFNFTESRLLAEIYRRALEEEGIPAEVVGEVASRELMEPALEQGQVDLVPEYLGTALTFLDATSELRSDEPAHASLQEIFSDRGITVLNRARGQNRNEIVVRRELAEEHGLKNVSDLEPIAGEISFGGPPECPARPLCMTGLEEVYGLRFEKFIALDSGGPRTLQALNGHEIDVALLFTTDPALQDPALVVLRDDRHLQPPENIVPVVRSEIVERYGSRLTDVVDRVTGRFTDRSLRRLNDRAANSGSSLATVAERWLTEERLI